MNNKKKVFVVAVAVCLIAILSLSSLAWFSDADEVTNKFMVATSDDPTDPDDIFFVDSTGWISPEPLHPLRDGHKTVAANLIPLLKEKYNL